MGKENYRKKNVNLQELADSLFLTCINSLRLYPQQEITHYGISGLLSLLTELYSLTDKLTEIPLDKIYTFLQITYKKKAVSANGNLYPEHSTFVKLADVMKLDMDIISGKKLLSEQ